MTDPSGERMMADEQPVAWQMRCLLPNGTHTWRSPVLPSELDLVRATGKDASGIPYELRPLYTHPSTPPAVSDDLNNDIAHTLSIYGAATSWDHALDVAKGLALIIQRREQQAAEAMRERCAVAVETWGYSPPPAEQLGTPRPEGVAFWGNTVDNRRGNEKHQTLPKTRRKGRA